MVGDLIRFRSQPPATDVSIIHNITRSDLIRYYEFHYCPEDVPSGQSRVSSRRPAVKKSVIEIPVGPFQSCEGGYRHYRCTPQGMVNDRCRFVRFHTTASRGISSTPCRHPALIVRAILYSTTLKHQAAVLQHTRKLRINTSWNGVCL